MDLRRDRALGCLASVATLGLALVACDGADDCDSHASTVCADGVTSWVDSCGQVEEQREACECGCDAAGTACLEDCCAGVPAPCETLGEVRCDAAATGTERCELDADGCLAWVTHLTCNAHQICSQGVCTCQNECDTPGELRCLEDLTGSERCQNDADGCLVWFPEETCQAGEACQLATGVCVLSCLTGDYDEDGFDDEFDNCPWTANTQQLDADADGFGDECDNCLLEANADQLDTDGNLTGDACDPDKDGDGVANAADDCELVPDPVQGDQDLDDLGDLCDPDLDEDGHLNPEDNCPFVANPDQLPTDPETYGDACDSDLDLDSISDSIDTCPAVSNPDQLDTDQDSRGDACDPDLDGDGLLNAIDNCPHQANPDQHDQDCDGLGDACDPP